MAEVEWQWQRPSDLPRLKYLLFGFLQSLLTPAIEASKCRGLVNGNRITWVTECPCGFVCSRCTWRLVRMDWNPWLTFSSLDKQIFHSIVFCIKCHCWKVSLNIYFWVLFYFRNIFSYHFCHFFFLFHCFVFPPCPLYLAWILKIFYIYYFVSKYLSLYISIFKLVFLSFSLNAVDWFFLFWNNFSCFFFFSPLISHLPFSTHLIFEFDVLS